MSDKITGCLEVGLDPDTGEIVINHPDLQPDKNGVGHIVFSANQARNLAVLLLNKAIESDRLRLDRNLKLATGYSCNNLACQIAGVHLGRCRPPEKKEP